MLNKDYEEVMTKENKDYISPTLPFFGLGSVPLRPTSNRADALKVMSMLESQQPVDNKQSNH